MRNRVRPGTADVTSCMAIDRDGNEVCVTLSGVYVKHVEGTYYDPPEGGFVEDVRAEDESGAEVILTDEEEEEAARMLFEEYDPDSTEWDGE